MPDPAQALAKASGLSRGRSRLQETLGDILFGGVDMLTGALGISTGVESKATTMGELLAAGLPLMGGMKAARGVKEAAKKGIKAYHGSPHDFDQFSLSKIGTGEGAQAYGHGLYFAESPETAGFYKDFLAKKADTPEYWESVKDRVPEFLGVGEQDELFKLKQKLAKNATNGPPLTAQESERFAALNGRYREYHEAVDALKPKGKMYEVSINADPEDFLDWDAPLSQQSEKVRQIASQIGPGAGVGPTKAKMQAFVSGGEDPSRGIIAKGEDLYRAASDYGGKSVQGSETLKQAGIPGIKYLDGASRSAGQGSRNYVVFDDSLIDILKKYGLAGGVVGTSLGQLLGLQTEAQQ